MIVPAYNEAEGVAPTIREIQKTLEEQGIKYEVIVVDDGSEDDTFAKALAVAKENSNVRAFSYRKNSGKGYAIKYGFQYARGDLVLFLDADSDLPAAQIPRFLGGMNGTDVDIIIGSKRHPLSKVDYPPLRRLLSGAYGLLVRALFNLKVTDTQTGIKLFRREVLDRVFPKVLIKRYAFDLELLANASRLRYRIAEAPVEVNYRFRSRISSSAVAGMFIDTLAIFYRMKILHYYDREAVR